MKTSVKRIFNTSKPVIAMLHLTYLEGKRFKGIDFVVKKALKDVRALQAGGIDGILIENWKEESVGEFVSEETSKNFTAAVKKISKHIKVPFGLNVLNNDYKVAFSVAKAVGASFIELDVFVDDVRSAFVNNANAVDKPFVIKPKPKEMWKYAKSIGASNIPLFCFVQPKHYTMLSKKKTIETSTRQAFKNGASAVLVTKATGFAPTVDLIKRAKQVAGKKPVGIGSGFSAENAKDFMPYIDFAVVGTSIKAAAETDNPVDTKKVRELMRIVRHYQS